MRWPRVRFTIRRMMIAVAVVALVLVIGIPISGRLL
jgi:Tfp pilus assembly protein FimT